MAYPPTVSPSSLGKRLQSEYCATESELGEEVDSQKFEYRALCLSTSFSPCVTFLMSMKTAYDCRTSALNVMQLLTELLLRHLGRSTYDNLRDTSPNVIVLPNGAQQHFALDL